MKRRRLEALERRLLRAKSTCQCLLAYCPQSGETRPPLEVICDRCGLWRDPQTVVVIEEIVVATREEWQTLAVNLGKEER
jgi:hypothetical protein